MEIRCIGHSARGFGVANYLMLFVLREKDVSAGLWKVRRLHAFREWSHLCLSSQILVSKASRGRKEANKGTSR